MVESKLRALVAGSLFESMIPPRDLAFAIIALYLGIDMLSHLDGDRARASRCSISACESRRWRSCCSLPSKREAAMSVDTRPGSRHGRVQLLGGAHRPAAARLADGQVRTLTFHPDRRHPLRDRVEALRYRFDDPVALARASRE